MEKIDLKNYIKIYSLAMSQVTSDLDPKYHGLLVRMLGGLTIGQYNTVTVTRKNIEELNFKTNKTIIGAFRNELANAGFWVRLGSDKYMINPEVTNNAPGSLCILLQKMYLAKGGLSVDYPQRAPHHEVREERKNQKLLEVDLQTDIKAAAKAMMLAKRPIKKAEKDNPKMDLMQKEIDNLKKSVSKIESQASLMWELLSDSNKVKYPQLYVVKS